MFENVLSIRLLLKNSGATSLLFCFRHTVKPQGVTLRLIDGGKTETSVRREEKEEHGKHVGNMNSQTYMNLQTFLM